MGTFGLNEQFKKIQDSAKQALETVFPIEGKTRVLKLEGVTVEDNLRDDDYSGQNKIKMKNGTWGTPVYAKLALYEKGTNKLLDKADKVRLFMLPKVTNRFSYIVNGNEYQVSNQLRLRPGAYTIRKQNGELKTMVNLAAGKNFDLRFDEQSAKFTIDKVGGGQARIPLYPVLINLGVSPSDIDKSWGTSIGQANKLTDEKVLTRARAAFGVRRGDLGEYFDKTKISPETTKMTLGQEFDRVNGPMLLAASKKLLDVHFGRQEAEDRDALQYKELHGIEDFIKERLEKNKETLAYKIKRTIDNPKRDKITQLVNPGSFNNVIESFFTQDDKSATPEQTNPLEMLSGQYKATIMGSGGIKSEHALTDDMREIHPSHYGFIDVIHTPESSRIGANLHLPLGFKKDGTELKSTVVDQKGNAVTLTPTQAFEKKIAFPGQKGPKYKVLYKGKTLEVNKSEVDYFTPKAEALFSWSSNLIPFLSSDQGNRTMMAAKMMEQAIALKHREAPLVQVEAMPGKSMESIVGENLDVKSPVDGIVKSISDDEIVIKSASGDVTVGLYNHFSLNRKSFLHHETKVKKGDKVTKGQLLAGSNFTKDGALALGINLKTAYIPYKGYNFEDGIVISETAAQKLTSEHIYKKSIDLEPNMTLKLIAFKSQYPNAITPENIKNLDNDGVIKKGSKVHQGDILIAALQKRELPKSVTVMEKKLSDRPKDVSVSWNYEDEGVVTDVQRSGSSITVFVKTSEPAKIGDKLAGRHGNKGIITKIIPDSEAPKDKEGNPVDVLLNPHGVISRINIGQMYESATAKAALKDGKPHMVKNFSGEDYLETVKGKLKKTDVDDKEELFDANGKSLGKVHVGNPYLLKLFKLSQANFSVRQGGPGYGYDANMQPLKAGGDESAKNLDVLAMYSMLSHGARANLREMSWLKSNSNDEFWKALKSGQTLPPPKTTFVFDKFVNYLKASGIDVKKEGTKMVLAPMTDGEVLKNSSGEVKKPMFFRAKDMEPIKNGFLDPVKFGGYKGTKWGHIELKESIVNPVFEKAVRKVTDLGTKYDLLMEGKLHYKDGEFNHEGKGVTGGAAVEKILKNINVDQEIETLLKKAKTAKGSNLDDVNKKLRYFMALKKFDLKPEEAYIRKNIAVIPPVYRPIYTLPDGSVTTSDVNLVYQNLGVLNTMQNLPVMDLLPEDEKSMIRKDIYQTAKGLSGLTDTNIKGKERQGFISEIAGTQPKEGLFISKMLSKKQDFVGRGTIIPEPSLGVDEVGLPDTMAWKLFEPFVVRELTTKLGKTPIQAIEEIKNKTSLAKKALEIVMKDRHVLLNRAPSLHKFSIMAFKPKITNGTAIKIPPLVVKGFNADFDGDTMTVHTPITDEANREAEKMLPSRNLYQPGTGKLMIVPSQEAQIGLFYLSRTPEGRKRVNKILGKEYAIDGVLNKKTTGELLTRLSKGLTAQEFGRVVADLKSAGEDHAYERGFTLGIDDIKDLKKERDIVVKAVEKDLKSTKSQEGLRTLNKKSTDLIDSILSKKLKDKNNPLFDMIESGARGDASQLRSIMASPLFVTDSKGKIVPHAIKKSYAEGLDIADYWTSMYGARRGMMDRAIQTSLPGAFSKDIMANTLDNVISSVDCGTKDGVKMNTSDKDVLGRYLAGDQVGLAHNTLVDSTVIKKIKGMGIQSIKVRSPLTCVQAKGTCAKCHGTDETGQLPEVGDNIGAKAGQSISEPLIQLVMNSFHTGGAAGTGSDVGGYKRIDQILKLPKIVPGAASLSPIDGVVKEIKKGVGGGYEVRVDNTTVHVSQGRNLKVSVGESVHAGDPLSDGVIKPQDLVKLKGMQRAQEYMVDELKKAYGGQGVNIDRKVFETVIRSFGNSTQVLNNAKGSNFVPGDIASYSQVKNYNLNLHEPIPLEEAQGEELAQDYGPLKTGTIIGPKEVSILRAAGFDKVAIKKEAIKHAPLLKSVTTLPILKRNWMASLGYRNLAKALVEGAGQAWETDLEDYHPIPAFAYGATFGGKDGKY